MADISLTAAMRTNLLALQQTADLLGRTQERLSTGKKVNSALDSPVNFFAAQSLNSRANDLFGFKDAISQSIKTINAADNSIKAITSLINSAKAVANDAKGVLSNSSGSQTLTISTLTGLSNAATIIIAGSTYTASVTASMTGGTLFYVGGTTSQAAASLAAAINVTSEASAGYDMYATVSNNVLTISPATAGTTMVTTSIQMSTAYSSFFAESSITGGADLTAKISTYNTLMTQLDTLKADAFYQGKNLLNAETMTVKFGNSHTLDVVGFQASASGLALDSTATTWVDSTTIDSSITKLDTALSTLQTNSSSLSSSLSIINARDQWITDIANTLQTGADKLVLADNNEEGANMLMLQTRQSLGVTSLSLASQQAQSVLRLFQ